MRTIKKVSTVIYNPKTKSLTINHVWNENAPDGGLSDLYDAIGDHDVITANEINEGDNSLLLSNGTDLYLLSQKDINTLKETGVMELSHYETLEKYIDMSNEKHVDFMKWLNG